jgi:riboflavin-specific deaminase-like protein
MMASPGATARPMPTLGPEVATAWSALLAAHGLARSGNLPQSPTTFAAATVAGLGPVAAAATQALIAWAPDSGWRVAGPAQGEARALLDLYLPLLSRQPGETLTLGHLGQSLDGYIATTRGESCFVTGPENILHLHCLRALCDAVLVGAETVAADDPRLTTRLVPGDNPVRVVLDPRRRLPVERRVFQDGAAPTLLVCAEGQAGPGHLGQAEVLAVPAHQGRLRLDALVAALHRRGLRRLFVEGGGLTVSSFLGAGLLDRLQVAVAPLLIGAGRRGLSLPALDALGDCLRPPCRVFRMGADILFDSEPRATPGGEAGGVSPGLARIR